MEREGREDGPNPCLPRQSGELFIALVEGDSAIGSPHSIYAGALAERFFSFTPIPPNTGIASLGRESGWGVFIG